MAACIYCGKRVGFFSKYHDACFSEAEKNRDLGIKIIGALIEVAMKERQPDSELQGQFSKVVSQYKLSSEVVGQTVISKVDELSKQEPLETTSAEYLLHLCENILGDSEKILPASPFYPSYAPTILNLGLS